MIFNRSNLKYVVLSFSFLVFAASCSKSELQPTAKEKPAAVLQAPIDINSGNQTKDGGGTIQIPIIQGIVTNPANTAVSKAVVRLIDLHAPFEVKIDTTDAEGFYSIEAAVSDFQVEFDAPGYAQKVIAPLQVRNDVQLNVVLE